jgi:hypothetical protein
MEGVGLMDTSVAQRVRHVIADQTGCGLDEVVDNMVEMAMALEEEFHIEIPDAEWEKACEPPQTVGAIVRLMEGYCGS